MNFRVKKWGCYYKIDSLDSYGVSIYDDCNDHDISYELKFPFHKYKEVMVRQFNGHLSTELNIYFDDEEDAKKAVEWAESIYVANILNKNI